MIPHQVWVNRLGLALFVFFMFLVAQPAVYSQPHQPEEEELLPIIHPSQQPQQFTTPPLPPTDPTYENVYGSAIAYEAFVNNNWEIHITSSQYSYFNVTNHPAADITPRLNYGSGRIVFASNRDGDFEIYSMQSDGTDLRQLTFNTAADLNPDWSPNGQQIVFESQRDGQSELYVMNADGTGLTRLTAYADFDGFPTWSPDGNYIAFSSRRNGGYRLYVFALATGQVQQLTNQPYSSYPVWSPDSSKIAFSADYNQNGWFDLWQIDLTTGVESLLQEYESFDLLASSWSPDGRYLASVQVIYSSSNSGYYISSIGNMRWNIATNTFQQFNSQSFPVGFVDWAVGDATPPQSSVDNLSSLTKIDDALISWSAVDPVAPAESFWPSGLVTVTLQYQLAENNNWVDWFTGSSYSTAQPFPAEGGQTVFFRSQAIDVVGNVENWGEADTSTTFYSWQLNGAVVDNRGLPVYQSVAVAPEPLTTNTYRSGAFQAILKTAAAHTFELSRPGYAQWPPTTRYSELPFLTYVPPLDNLLENGSFETAGLEGWQPTGNTTTTPHYFNSGQTALKAGTHCTSNCLTTAQIIPNTVNQGETAFFYSTSDREGNVYLFWEENNDDIYFAWRDLAGSWSAKQLLASDINTHNSKILLDSNRTIHLLWGNDSPNNGSQGIFYISRPWGEPSQPKKTITHDYKEVLDFHVNQNNQPFFVTHLWNSQDVDYIFFIQTTPGQWASEAIPFFNSSLDSRNFLEVGHDNSLYFFWNNYYGIRRPDGRLIYTQLIPNNLYPSSILIDVVPTPDREKFYLFYTSGGGSISYQILDMAQGWSDVKTVPHHTSHYYHSAQIDNLGHIYLLKGNFEFRLQRYTPQTGWLPLLDLPEYDRGHVVLDSYNNPHIITKNFNGFYYTTLAPAATAETAAWSQTITIPVTMTNPTLSFMYQTVRDVPGDETGLQVEISNGLTPTVQLLPPAAGWELAWLDVSQWAGQQVTVTFQLNQATDAPQMELYVDDVSLGSALPDVWVGLESNVGALPGETVVYHLEYGNLSGVTAVSPTITLTLPAPLSFISATVPPLTSTNSVMVWSTADLPAQSTGETIVITAVVTASTPLGGTFTGLVEIAVPEEEVEQANNQLQLRLFIGRYQFLPLIVRD